MLGYARNFAAPPADNGDVGKIMTQIKLTNPVDLGNARRGVLAAQAIPDAGRSNAPADVGTLDHHYVRERIGDIVPLVKECYENALRDSPALEGKVVVEFALSGEPGAGAVIEESKILEGSTIGDPSLRECVQETMYAVELRAPERGGRLVVTYPFVLHPLKP